MDTKEIQMKYLITTFILAHYILNASPLKVLSKGEIDLSNYPSSINNPATEDINSKKYKKITIKSEGKAKSILVEIPSSIHDSNMQKVLPYREHNTSTPPISTLMHAKLGFMIQFKEKPHNLQAFAKKYHLKFKHKMAIGYYIFDNISNNPDTTILADILASEENNKIFTIKPNWPLRMQIH